MRGANSFRRWFGRQIAAGARRSTAPDCRLPWSALRSALRKKKNWKRLAIAASVWTAGLAGTASAGTFFVTNTNDNGIGSFRQALLDAEANGGPDTIVFDDNLGVISLLSPLPAITEDVIVQGGAGNSVDAQGVRSVIVQGGLVSISNVAYTDGTTIDGGTLVVSQDADLGDASGGLTFGGGTLQTSAGIITARDVVLDPGGGTIDTNGFDSLFSGAFSGTGDLTKTGAGLLQLSGNNAGHSGDTFVTGGTLEVTSQANLGLGTLTLDGGTLRQNNSNSFNRAIALGSGGGTFQFQSGTATVSSQISGAGDLTIDSTGGLFLYGNNTYTGKTIINQGVVVVQDGGNFGTGDVEYNGGTVIIGGTDVTFAQNFVVTGGRQFRSTNLSTTFSGDLTGTGSVDFNAAGGPTIFLLQGTNTYTGGTSLSGLGSVLRLDGGTLDSQGPLDVGSGTTFDLNGQTQTIGALSGSGNILLGAGVLTTDTEDDSVYSGGISGSGSFTKAGNGTLTLSGTNSHTGGTNLNGGVVEIGSDAALGDASGGLAFDGGTLRLSTGVVVNRATTLDVGGGTIETAAMTNSTFAGDITGAGGLAVTGGGTLSLAGTNSYLGDTTIDSAAVTISSDNNLGAGAILFKDGTLRFDADMTVDNSIVFDSGFATFETDTRDVTLSGAIFGGGTLRKYDSGTLTLTGVNYYAGGNEVYGGALRGDTDSLQGDVFVDSGTSLIFDQAFDGAFAGVISGDGSLLKTGAGRVTLEGINLYTGGTQINGGTLAITGDDNLGDPSGPLGLDGGTLSFSGCGCSSIDRVTTLGAGGGTFETLDFSDSLVLDGDIGGVGSLTKTGDGYLELNGTNTYLGGTTINGGILGISADENLGAAGTAIQINTAALSTLGTFEINRNITIGGMGAFIDVYDDEDILGLTGVISGTADLYKTGWGLLELKGTNTYQGDTLIIEGGLAIDSDAALGDASGTVHIGAGAAFGFNNDITSSRGITLDYFGSIATLDNTVTLSGVISGNGALLKITEGTLILDGANTYDGGTVVQEGTLRLGTNGSLESTGSLVIFPDAVFDLNGRTQTVGTFMGAGELQLGSGAFTTDSDDDSLFEGVISGSGSFTKAGDSELELAGINVHTGGTNINGGTLAISDDVNLGATASDLSFDGGGLFLLDDITSLRDGAFNANGGVIDTNGFDASFSGAFSGAGGLTKEGLGRLELLGANTYAGQTVINGGNLAANGSLTGSVLVNQGGTLSGAGEVGTVANDGIVAPGNSIDTLQIAGNFSQTADGVLEIEIAPGSGNNDRLEITGTATLAGTLQVQGGGATTFSVNQAYTFLTADGGVSGTFDTVTEDLAFLKVVMDYSDPSAVSFTLGLDGTNFQSVALTPNQKAVAGALDTISPSATGDLAVMLQDMLGLTTSQAQAAYNQLSGEIFASSAAATVEQGQMALRIMAERLRPTGSNSETGFAMQVPSPDQVFSMVSRGDNSAYQDAIQLAGGSTGPSRGVRNADYQQLVAESLEGDVGIARTWDGWIEGSGQSGSFSGNGNASSANYGFGGLNFGAGYYLDNETVIGVLGGYHDGSVRGGGSGADKANVETTQVGLYGRTSFDHHYLTGIVNYGRQDYATDRVVNIGGIDRNTAANYDANQLGALLEYGQNRSLGMFVLQPLASLQYINQQTDSYTERAVGAGGATLAVAGRTDDSLRGSFGARLMLPLANELGQSLIPEIHARYMYEFLDDGRNIAANFTSSPGTPFTIEGVNSGNSFIVYGAGLSYVMSQHISLYGHYIGQATSDLTSHTGTGGIQFTW